MAAELIKASLLPPIISSDLSALVTSVSMLVPCSDLPCVLALVLHSAHAAGPAGWPGVTDSSGLMLWPAFQKGETGFECSSILLSAFVQIICCCIWDLGTFVTLAWNQTLGSKALQRVGAMDMDPEGFVSKLGDPAVLCSSRVCVFWVTMFNFTAQSIQNSWQIPPEIRNSLAIFISSSFSLQWIKAIYQTKEAVRILSTWAFDSQEIQCCSSAGISQSAVWTSLSYNYSSSWQLSGVPGGTKHFLLCQLEKRVGYLHMCISTIWSFWLKCCLDWKIIRLRLSTHRTYAKCVLSVCAGLTNA